MNISVTFITTPAQEFKVQIAVPAREVNGGRAAEQCALRNKYRTRTKVRRAVLEVRPVLHMEATWR